MKARCRELLIRCIEDGIKRGYNKAHKHTSTPSEDELIDQVEHYIWLEIDQFFDFEPYEEAI